MHGKTKIVHLSMGEAKKRFLEEMQARSCRARTISDYEKFFGYASGFDGRKMDSITEADAKKIISLGKSGCRLSDESAVRSARLFRTLFYWGIRKGHCRKNPFMKFANPAKPKKKKLVQVYDPASAKALIAAFDEGHHAAALLMAYAGIRPEEIVSEFPKETLKWGDIDFKRKEIRVGAGVSKTGEERLICDIPDILWKKLKPFSKMPKKDHIACCFETFRAARTKACEACGIEWIQDGFRHSFASYAYHIIGIDRAVEVLGHDHKTFKTYYMRAVTKKDAHEYFEMKMQPAKRR